MPLKKYAGRFELIDLTKLPLQETLERVAALPPDTIVLYSTILRDGAGQTFAPLDVLHSISRASNAPVFYLYDTGIGHGSVGGRLISMELQGRTVANLTLRVTGRRVTGSHSLWRRRGLRQSLRLAGTETLADPG